MLVVYLHTLQAVNVLHLVDDVLLHGRRALDGQDVGRGDNAVGQRCAGTHGIVLLNQNLLGERHEVLALLAGLGCNDNLAVATLYLAHGDLAVDFADNGRVGRVAGLEELGDTGKTSGDVTGLAHGTRYLDEGLTGLYGLSVLNHHVASHREVVGADLVAVGIDDVAGWNLRLVFRLGDNLLGESGGLVGLGTVSNTLDDVVELKRTGVLGDNHGVERVPLGNLLALGHDVARLVVE